MLCQDLRYMPPRQVLTRCDSSHNLCLDSVLWMLHANDKELAYMTHKYSTQVLNYYTSCQLLSCSLTYKKIWLHCNAMPIKNCARTFSAFIMHTMHKCAITVHYCTGQFIKSWASQFIHICYCSFLPKHYFFVVPTLSTPKKEHFSNSCIFTQPRVSLCYTCLIVPFWKPSLLVSLRGEWVWSWHL